MLDEIAPTAIRILDEPHAAEHLGILGALLHGQSTPAATAWTATQRRRLQKEPPEHMLAELEQAAAQGPHPHAPAGPEGLSPAKYLAREG